MVVREGEVIEELGGASNRVRICDHDLMTTIDDPWTSRRKAATSVMLEPFPVDVMAALACGDLSAASSLTPLKLPPYLVCEDRVGVWRMRQAQVAKNPSDASWVTRFVVDPISDQVVGMAGYHGPPNQVGMVEVGYAIAPAYRRRGYARSALLILLETAMNHPHIAVVRATVRPDNVASRQLLDQYGFRQVGSQWDEEDGFEIILEVATWSREA